MDLGIFSRRRKSIQNTEKGQDRSTDDEKIKYLLRGLYSAIKEFVNTLNIDDIKNLSITGRLLIARFVLEASKCSVNSDDWLVSTMNARYLNFSESLACLLLSYSVLEGINGITLEAVLGYGSFHPVNVVVASEVSGHIVAKLIGLESSGSKSKMCPPIYFDRQECEAGDQNIICEGSPAIKFRVDTEVSKLLKEQGLTGAVEVRMGLAFATPIYSTNMRLVYMLYPFISIRSKSSNRQVAFYPHLALAAPVLGNNVLKNLLFGASNVKLSDNNIVIVARSIESSSEGADWRSWLCSMFSDDFASVGLKSSTRVSDLWNLVMLALFPPACSLDNLQYFYDAYEGYDKGGEIFIIAREPELISPVTSLAPASTYPIITDSRGEIYDAWFACVKSIYNVLEGTILEDLLTSSSNQSIRASILTRLLKDREGCKEYLRRLAERLCRG